MMEHMMRNVPVSEIKGRNIHLGLPNGLIGLGNGDYLVRDNVVGCVAAGLDFSGREIRFEVKNGKEEHYTFRFYLLKGVSVNGALGFANDLNNIEP